MAPPVVRLAAADLGPAGASRVGRGRRWGPVPDIDASAQSPDRTAWWVALLLLVVVGPLVPIATAQPLVRFAQTAALVEHRTLELDAYEPTLLVDRVDVDGHVYSDKAPLPAFLGAPVYAVGRALGMESAAVDRPEGNLGLWWMTFWTASVPAAVLVLLMVGAARRVAPAGATMAAVGLAFGSLLLPFAGQLYGHVLCATLAFGSWRLMRERGSTPWAALAAGSLAGAAVATEYPMALVGVILAVALGALHGWRQVPLFAAGAAPFGALLLWYHNAAFGDPLADPYRLKPQHEGASAAVTGLPRPGQALEVLVGTRGMFLIAPVTLLGVIGLVILLRRGGRHRVDALVGLSVAGVLWLLQAGWANPWGGEMPGPRYLIPALPFLAVGVAVVAERAPTVTRVAIGWGIAAMAGPLLTVHLVLGDGVTGLAHLENLRRWGFTPPVPAVVLGGPGWLIYLAAVGAVAIALGRHLRSRDGADRVGHEQEFATSS